MPRDLELEQHQMPTSPHGLVFWWSVSVQSNRVEVAFRSVLDDLLGLV